MTEQATPLESRELPSGWAIAPVEQIVEADAPVIYGILQPGPDMPDGVRYVRPTEIVEDRIAVDELRRTSPAIAARYARATLRRHDVVLSIVGTIGKVALVPAEIEGANITQSSARVRANQDVLRPSFLAWALRSPQLRRQFDSVRLGTAVPRLNIAHVRALQIPIAPLPEQDRIIAEIEKQFTRLDAATASLRRAAANLARYRASALKAACEGRLVGSESKLVTLGEIADIQGGITLGKKRKPEEETRPVPYLRVANVQRGYLDLREMKTIEATEEEVRRLRLEPGDVLFNEGGDRDKLGRGWVWNGELPECLHQNHVFRARIREEVALPKFVSHYGNSVAQQYFWTEGKHTTNMASINRTKLGLLPIRLPPLEVQADILSEVERRLSIVEESERAVERGLARASRLRQAILQRAFEGKLVPQDHTDEPASALLERIEKEQESEAATPKRGRKRTSAHARRPPG